MVYLSHNALFNLYFIEKKSYKNLTLQLRFFIFADAYNKILGNRKTIRTEYADKDI
jgi:hypothetical protein